MPMFDNNKNEMSYCHVDKKEDSIIKHHGKKNNLANESSSLRNSHAMVGDLLATGEASLTMQRWVNWS
jgi:hypothetical protein